MSNTPYDPEDIAALLRKWEDDPHAFDLPQWPSAWDVGTLDDRVEALMHLGLGIQKAVLKFVHRWMTIRASAPAMSTQLAVLLSLIQKILIRLSFGLIDLGNNLVCFSQTAIPTFPFNRNIRQVPTGSNVNSFQCRRLPRLFVSATLRHSAFAALHLNHLDFPQMSEKPKLTQRL